MNKVIDDMINKYFSDEQKALLDREEKSFNNKSKKFRKRLILRLYDKAFDKLSNDKSE